ncbi:anthranilate phosphoribosyltransferase [Pseudoneobacillus rhizosphaerae]|uniref:Anthranilate phosphoribosyltransferase n=1 Tax=Pseudoneobacillus rhizosphaerae TaxID=2880968 RepID=A0A9C7GD20_9BACI|nr:anthranilate phosphoribosyltransferase [Pseudoneobacillus rhizosphaerae]CAG9610189.1 Anthranilate phosphoribosyltransferase 2 [Pseudoneobacillus rhizosphaerae]
MKEYLQRLANRESFSEEEMQEAVGIMLNDEQISDSEIAAFLVALKTKGETVDEISGLVKAIRLNTIGFRRSYSNVMDNCGTGGDGSSSFNVSTTSAFVIAGCGITVAKHGNRSISSKTGSADVLEQLGVELSMPTQLAEELLEEIGIAFLFAPHVHPRLKKVMKVRRELQIPTIFNFIGPLTNPVDLDSQLLGINRRDYLEVFAEVLNKLGRKRALVLNGAGKLDEASLEGENHLIFLQDGVMNKMTLHPEEVGLPSFPNSAIKGGDSKRNAEILLQVLKGEEGAYRDTVLLNAGLAIFTSGIASTIPSGINIAKESIDSGAAYEKLVKLVEKSRVTKQEVI